MPLACPVRSRSPHGCIHAPLLEQFLLDHRGQTLEAHRAQIDLHLAGVVYEREGRLREDAVVAPNIAGLINCMVESLDVELGNEFLDRS